MSRVRLLKLWDWSLLSMVAAILLDLRLTFYDEEVDVLRLLTGENRATSASLVDPPDVVVDLPTSDGHHVVGIMVMGVSAYLPLGKRWYDAGTDTLTLGTGVDAPVASWKMATSWPTGKKYEDEPGVVVGPVGVAVNNASTHLSAVTGRMNKAQ